MEDNHKKIEAIHANSVRHNFVFDGNVMHSTRNENALKERVDNEEYETIKTFFNAHSPYTSALGKFVQELLENRAELLLLKAFGADKYVEKKIKRMINGEQPKKRPSAGGRPRTYTDDDYAVALSQHPEKSYTLIAYETGISKSQLQRMKKKLAGRN